MDRGLLDIENLIIEVTRRCNMKCEHCLRGRAQNIDINPEWFREFTRINRVNYIDYLSITGGEPSLVPQIIYDIATIIEEEQINVGSFYMVTNAKDITIEFLAAVIKLHLVTDDKENNELSISNDIYHDSQPDFDKVMALSFAKQREKPSWPPIREGRAIRLPGSRKQRLYDELFIEDDKVIGELYLNAIGDLTYDCNLSYTHQKKLKVGDYKSYLADIINIKYPEEIAA